MSNKEKKTQLIFWCDNCETEWKVKWNIDLPIRSGDLNCVKCYPGVKIEVE